MQNSLTPPGSLGIVQFGIQIGQRFMMVQTSEQEEDAATQIHVVLNWFEELKRRVPPGDPMSLPQNPHERPTYHMTT